MTLYCSLAEAKAELEANLTTDDAKVLRYVRQVSARIDKLMSARRGRPYFAPWVEDRPYPLIPARINSWRGIYYLDEPILSVTSASAAGTDITSLVELVPAYNAVVSQIRFINNCRSWYDYCPSTGVYPATLTIGGVWGYAPHYADAWLAYDQITTAVLAPGGTTFKVNDADGADPNGITPRFSPGLLVRFGGGSEINEVTAVDTTTNTVTVNRAVNGSTAASGNVAIGTDVEVFQVEDVIRRVTARQAALLYARRGAFQVETVDGVGTVSYPQDLLTEMAATLDEYHNLS